MKKFLLLHPFLFALFPALFLFSHNIDQVLFLDALPVFAVLVGGVLFLGILLKYAARNDLKAACILSLIIVVFFVYKPVYVALNTVVLVRHRILLPVILGVCAGGVVAFVRTRRDLTVLSHVLTLMGSFMVVIPLVGIGRYHMDARGGARSDLASSVKPLNRVPIRRAADLPDIYYLIFDGYAGGQTLRDVFGYDNSAFSRYLRSRGFYLSDQSRSNYSTTYFSLASSLNMEYINGVAAYVSGHSDMRLPFNMVRDNKVVRALQGLGYAYIHFGTEWGPTCYSPYAQRNIRRYPWLSEFLLVFIRETMLTVVHDRLLIGIARENLRYTFEELEEVVRVEGPKFVFAHIIVPHNPYVFGSSGERVPFIEPFPVSPAADTAYLHQLMYVNTRIRRIVDTILTMSTRPPVIILQADHGWKFSRSVAQGTDAISRHSMNILNAYYMPDGNSGLYPAITPVNSFRVVFNRYLGGSYDVLDDRSYFCGSGKDYEFVDVTGVMQGKGR